MANEVKLETYTLRIRKAREKEYLKLGDLNNNQDFFELVKNYFKSHKNAFIVLDRLNKSLKIESKYLNFSQNDRTICGILSCGEYGLQSDIINIRTRDHKYTKETIDSDIKPYYLLIFIPDTYDKGLLILQRTGIFGIHGILKNHFEQYFKKSYSDLMIEFSPLILKDLARKFIEDGFIKELTLRRYNLPSDVIDKLGLHEHSERIMSLELKLVAKRRSSLPYNNRVKKFIDNPNAVLFDIPEFSNLGFDGGHKTSIRTRLGNNVRTIDLAETGLIRPYYDIDQEVSKESTGHPIFESINSITKDLLCEIQYELYQ